MELALAGSFVLVILYNLLFYQVPTGIGFVFFILLLNLFFLLASRTHQTNKLVGITYGTLATIFAFLLAFRANFIVQLIDLFATFFFSLAALFAYRLPKIPELEITSFLLSPAKVIGNAITDFSSNLKVEEFGGLKRFLPDEAVQSLRKGILVAIPIVLILYIILRAADPIFAAVSNNFFKSIGNRVIISTILFGILLALGIVRIKGESKKVGEETTHQAKSIELGIIIGAVIILFATFIIVQFQYLFSNIDERQLHTIGVKSLTYSEYVRKGFFELLLASGIASLLINFGNKYVHKFTQRKKIIVQILLAILATETGLILLSAAQRLNLYQVEHGLTRARVFGFVFLLWLAAVLLILILQVVSKQKRETIFVTALSVTTLAMLSLNAINVDKLIAVNFKPTVNKEIDYSYIASLSPDAHKSWMEIVTSSQQLATDLYRKEELSSDDRRKLQLAKISLGRLESKMNLLIGKYASNSVFMNWYLDSKYEADVSKRIKNKWHSFNFSQHSAYKELENNIDFYKQISPTLDQLFQLEGKTNEKQDNQEVPLDRPVQAPLTF